MNNNKADKIKNTELELDKLLLKLEDKSKTLSIDHKIEILWELSDRFKKKSLVKCKNYLVRAKELGEENNNKKLLAKTILKLSMVLINQAIYDEAIEILHTSLEIFEQLNYKKGIADSKRIIASALHFSSKENYELILNFCNEAEKIYQDLKDTEGLILINNSFGAVYLADNNLKNAIFYFKQGLLINDGRNKDHTILLLTNLAVVYEKKGEYYTALEFINEALNLCDLEYDQYRLSSIYANLAIIHGKLDNPINAEKYLKKGLVIAKELNENSLVFHFYKELSNYYEKEGNFKESLINYKLHSELKDKVFTLDKEEIISKTILNYKKEQNKKELIDEQIKSTELLRMNNELKYTHDEIINLEKKNSVLAMIVTANHEINQPLTILSGNIDILKERLKKETIDIEKYSLIFDRVFSRSICEN